MKVKSKVTELEETARVLLDETVEWSGKLLQAYAQLQEAERNNDEDALDMAWADVMTALFLLKDKAEQTHQLMDEATELLDED